MKITNALQTNGILLNSEWGGFLKEHTFLVGISIDGPKKVHDRYRIDGAGRPTFDAVMRGLEVLQRHEVEHNALTTVHRANGGKGKEVYKFLKGRGIEFMQFIPIAERSGTDGLAGAPQVDMGPGNTVTPWSVSPRAYGKFLCACSTLGLPEISARSSCNSSTCSLGCGWDVGHRCESLPKPAATAWRWNMTAVSILAITTSIRTSSWAMSPRPRCATYCGQTASALSAVTRPIS